MDLHSALKSFDTSPNFLLIIALLENRVRIPAMATTLSGAWRPRDPVDDDQGGARA
jgi:hypothetical protein